MTNPFNQSRFRNEHELGSAYKVVSEVHDQLDIINFLAQNLKEVRSGNIELKSDEEGKIYWKYVKSEEWILWGDMTEWFEPLVASLQENQGEQAGRLDQLQSEIDTTNQRIDADIIALGELSDTVQADRNVLDNLSGTVGTLSSQVAQNIQDILTIQGELQTLDSTSTAYGNRLDSLENSLTNLDSALNTLQDGLEPRLTAIENGILGIQNTITDVTNRLELLENG